MDGMEWSYYFYGKQEIKLRLTSLGGQRRAKKTKEKRGRGNARIR